MKRMVAAALMTLSITVFAGAGLAERMEFTPGPRMIQALEHIAHGYLAHAQAIDLAAAQRERIQEILRDFKKEMWMREAVLVGMFMELEAKRRYGLLEENEYRTANVVTAGLETDELNLLIIGLQKLQDVFSETQQAKLRDLMHPTLSFDVPQGFTTKIALLSLGGIGRIHQHREALRLTNGQDEAIRANLTEARAELLRLGTAIDINRTEAYELLERPFVDPEAVRAKMQKTGELEGVLFSRLLDLSKEVEGILTPEQRVALREQKRDPPAGGTTRAEDRGHDHGRAGSAHAHDLEGFRFFLDQIHPLALTPGQIAQLVDLKNQTTKALLEHDAKRKARELELLALLQRRSADGVGGDGAITQTIRRLEAIEAKDLEVRVGAYLTARQILTEAQRARVHPPAALEAR